jgi:hypothetical protein
MSNGTLLTDATIGSLEHVAVSRQLVQRGRRIEGTVDIWPVTDEPLVVRVVDEFPEDIPVEWVWFDPETEPQGGTITSERAAITQVVEGESVTVEYVIKLSEVVEPVEVDPPTVREVEGAAFTGSGDGWVPDEGESVGDAGAAGGDGSDHRGGGVGAGTRETATTDGGGGQFDWVGDAGGTGTDEGSADGGDESGDDAFEFGSVVEPDGTDGG